MPDRRKPGGPGTGWLPAAAVVVAVALISAAVARAAQDTPTPFRLITAWQLGALKDTEFSTHPVVKKEGQYFLVRHVKEGELFPGLMKRYCEAAGLGADECKSATARAEDLHGQEHWHKNWQPDDRAYLLIPEKVYKAAEPEQK